MPDLKVESVIVSRRFYKNVISVERSERYRLRKKEENEQALKEEQTKDNLNVSSTVHQR